MIRTMAYLCLIIQVSFFLVLLGPTPSTPRHITLVILQPPNTEVQSDTRTNLKLPQDVDVVEDTDGTFVLTKDFVNTTAWLFVIDMRGHQCPSDLHVRVIGYFSVNSQVCTSVNNTQHISIATYLFDYRRFVHALILDSMQEEASVTVIYDETGQEYRKYEDSSFTSHLFFQIDVYLEQCTAKHTLKTIASKTEVKYIMLIASTRCVEDILNQAKQLDMVEGRYYWIVFPTDSTVPRCEHCAKHSAIVVRDNSVNTEDTQYRPLVQRLIDFTSDVIVELSSGTGVRKICDCQIHCEACFSAVHTAVDKLCGSQTGIYLQKNYLKQYPVSFDIVRYASDGSPIKVGQWDGETIDRNSSLYPDNYTAIVLRVISLVEPPFVFRNSSGEHLSYYGYSIDAIQEIAKRVGFTFTVKECSETLYGYAGADGQWTGCIGNVLRGEADIIVAALTVTAERERVVDFTLPYYDFAGIQILMRKPNRNISLFYFADVFTPIAWLCLGVVVVVTSILLMFFDRFTPMSENADDIERSQSFDLKESIWYVLGSLTMSGGGAPPRSVPARILVAGFWFFSIVIMSTFTANLAAFLTVSRMGASISSLNDLASQSDVSFSVVKDTSIMNYFQRMAAIEDNFYTIWKDMSMGVYGDAESLAVWDYPLGDKYVNIWKSINATGFMNSSEEALARLAQGNFAFFTDSPVVKYLTSRSCELTAVGDVFSIRPYAFALKDKSTWTKKISAAILELQKERILEELKMKWWTKGAVQCPDGVSDQGLDVKSLAGSFIVVAVAISSGLLVLALEFMWNTFRRRKPHTTFRIFGKQEQRTDMFKSTDDKTHYVISCNNEAKMQYSMCGDELDTLY